MVSSKAQTVDDFLAEVPPERLPVVKKLRALCKKVLKGYTEGMQYGMPCYLLDGVPEVAFQNQKQYISLYIGCDRVAAEHAELLEGLDCGKSCIRFKKPEQIDFKRVEKLLNAVKKTKPPATKKR